MNEDLRHSSTGWCKNECELFGTTRILIKRVNKLLGTKFQNSEHLQFLKYEKGEYFKTHHDLIPEQNDKVCGPRVLTFLMYFNDLLGDDDGGETEFPLQGIKVKPKIGRAVLWSNVKDENVMEIDERTVHASLEVNNAPKHAANLWVHLYDFRLGNKWDCN